MNPKHYSMIIQWDDQDEIYIVTVPELPGCKTHGKTIKKQSSKDCMLLKVG